MLNVRKAQRITMELSARFKENLAPVKWSDIYISEQAIMDDLMKVHVPEQGEWNGPLAIYKGYEFIHSFAHQVQSGEELSEEQIVQCKRLALEIKKAASIADCYNDIPE